MVKRMPPTSTNPKTNPKKDLNRTQKKPHENEELFRVAQELSADGFTILRPVRDEHGQIVDFTWVYENAAIARMNGTNQTAVMGKRVLELFPNHTETPFYKAYVEVAESGETRVVEAQYQSGGMAELKWLRVTVVRTGEDISIFGQDVTERKNAEARMKADLAALTRLHKLSGRVLDSGGLQLLLQEIMDAAVEIVGAEKGTLQLLEGDSLRIVAHHGHQRPFLEFFESAETRASVCGEATRRGERVIVPDIEMSSLFEGTPSQSVLRSAGVRAVQSTPISSRTGTLLGILTTQWGAPYTPDEQDLWRLDLLVRQAADLIEHAKAEEALRWQNAIQRSMQAVLNAAMNCSTEEELGHACLAEAEKLSESKFGFLDEINAEGQLDVIAISDPGWDASRIPLGQRQPPRNMAIRGLYGRVIQGSKGFFTNDPTAHSDFIGLPPGHPPLTAFLGVPLIREGRAIGIIAVGNREGGYTKTQQDALEALMPAVVEAFIRKRSEEALRESEERLRLTQSAANIGIWEWQLQSDKLAWTPELEQIYGYAAGTFPGNYAGFSERVHSDDLAEVERQWNEAVKAHRSFDFDFRVRRSEAEIRWVNCKGGAVYDQAGHPQRIFGVNVDITQRKQAEEQLIHNQKTFSELVERAPFGIYVVDSRFCIAHMNISSQNDAFRNVRPLIGRNFSEAMHTLWHESVAEEIIGHFRHTLETGDPYYSPRFTNPRQDVEITESYEWELHRITLPDGQHGVICYYFDSTKLRNAELALQEANATLEKKVKERTLELSQRAVQLRALAGELTLSEQRERSRLAKVLHDHLQQLLVAAKFRLTVLGRGGDDVVKQANKEVEELIDESITASRSLTAELSPPILHDAGLKEGLIWLARRMAEKHGLFVDLEMEEHEPLSEQLKIILFESVRELLFNVVKHARTSAANVSLRHIGSHLQVTVSDQGAGFDSATMSIVGEERKGFGLFAIRERLGFMGGTLQIQSTPGQGSLFVLAVPIALTEKIEPQSQEIVELPESFVMPSGHPDPGQKILVMLADDHAVVRQGIANLLGDEPDIEVIGQAADGQETVEMAARLLPHVILMDMSMPKLNGVEATRIIHNDWPDIRIIGLSMFEEADRAQAMRDAGAVDYMTKSGQPEELITAIRTAASRSK
jgi:PAS domain S-box-containing protein